MYDFPPVMREQGRLAATATAAKAYGSEHPGEFGGVHWANEPRVHVVFLATAHLDVHLHVLRSRVPHPDRVEVRPCRYTDHQIDAWLEEAAVGCVPGCTN